MRWTGGAATASSQERLGSRACEIASRLLAAAFGGYVLAAASAVALAGILPMARVDAVLTGLLFSFATYTAAVLWAFAARTVWRAWTVLVVLTAALSIAACLTTGARLT